MNETYGQVSFRGLSGWQYIRYFLFLLKNYIFKKSDNPTRADHGVFAFKYINFFHVKIIRSKQQCLYKKYIEIELFPV